jgi:hypothetical protein
MKNYEINSKLWLLNSIHLKPMFISTNQLVIATHQIAIEHGLQLVIELGGMTFLSVAQGVYSVTMHYSGYKYKVILGTQFSQQSR